MIPVYGGYDFLIQPDILTDHVGSADDGRVATLETARFPLMGNPGDSLLRRAHLSVEHEGEVTLVLTVILDGVPIQVSQFSGSGNGKRTWMVPVSRVGPSPARGRTVQFRISSTSPRHRWHISDLVLEYRPGRASRGST